MELQRKDERDIDGVLAMATEALDELLTRHKADAAVHDLEMQLDLREKFFSLVSHDLRSPLTVIKVSAQLVKSQPDDAERCKLLASRIVSAADRLERMVTDVLDANRYRAGVGFQGQLIDCNLDELLRSLAEDMAIVHKAGCHYETCGPTQGRFDPALLRRAVENLIINGMKYGSSESPVVVSLAVVSEHAEISVNNRGNPMSAREMQTLFQWHNRTKGALHSGKQGWGLGLMLVKGIAEAHRGSVRVECSAEAGTTFTLRLPLKESTERRS